MSRANPNTPNHRREIHEPGADKATISFARWQREHYYKRRQSHLIPVEVITDKDYPKATQ